MTVVLLTTTRLFGRSSSIVGMMTTIAVMSTVQTDRPTLVRSAAIVGTGCTLNAARTIATTTIRTFKFINAFVFDSSGKCCEHFFHIVSSQGRCFKELDPIFVSQLFAFVVCYNTIIVQIGFVPTQYNVTIRWCTCFDVSHPSNHMIKRRSIRNVVRQNKSIRSTEKVAGQTTETFLTSGIPQLQPHLNTFNFNHFVTIIDANRCNEFRAEYILIKSQYQRCFPTRGITNHEESDNVRSFGTHLQWTWGGRILLRGGGVGVIHDDDNSYRRREEGEGVLARWLLGGRLLEGLCWGAAGCWVGWLAGCLAGGQTAD